MPDKVTRQELLNRYGAEGFNGVMDRKEKELQATRRQTAAAAMAGIALEREVNGWMLLQCEVMDSSRLGEMVILPYGPGCTFKEPPDHPISPRGLASDMSVVVAYTEER